MQASCAHGKAEGGDRARGHAPSHRGDPSPSPSPSVFGGGGAATARWVGRTASSVFWASGPLPEARLRLRDPEGPGSANPLLRGLGVWGHCGRLRKTDLEPTGRIGRACILAAWGDLKGGPRPTRLQECGMVVGRPHAEDGTPRTARHAMTRSGGGRTRVFGRDTRARREGIKDSRLNVQVVRISAWYRRKPGPGRRAGREIEKIIVIRINMDGVLDKCRCPVPPLDNPEPRFVIRVSLIVSPWHWPLHLPSPE